MYSFYQSNKNYYKFLVKQSDEGGRFYHDESFNSLVQINKKQKTYIENNINSKRYNWVDLGSIVHMIKKGGPINMQLRGIIAMFSSEVF